MYLDIKESKRFAVTLQQGDRLAEFGVLFQVTEVQDVAKQTEDQIKYLSKPLGA